MEVAVTDAIRGSHVHGNDADGDRNLPPAAPQRALAWRTNAVRAHLRPLSRPRIAHQGGNGYLGENTHIRGTCPGQSGRWQGDSRLLDQHQGLREPRTGPGFVGEDSPDRMD